MTARAGAADETFDYVVVGSGAGGGPVAANLAEAGLRVLLLEAGLDDEDDDYRVPAFHGRASENPGMSRPFFVRHFDDRAQQERDVRYRSDQDGVLYPRSGTLGGCTAHNAMITMYPHDADWDAIARLTGDRSWRAGRMRRWFEQLEACARAGSVLLRSADPRDTPDVRFRYFEEGSDGAREDLDAVVTGTEAARSIMRCLANDVDGELVPGAEKASRADLRSFVRDQAWGHHASCTCAIGRASDPRSVLGSDFHVHGTQRLRVVDASVFRRIPGFFLVTAIYMVAEKASALIAAAATSDAAPARTASSLDLRQVLGRLPHPRKPFRSTVQEQR